MFVEFRHDSWLTPQLEPSLRAHRMGYCVVDEPQLPGLLPPVTMLTTEDAYVRFHGRNARNWWSRDHASAPDLEGRAAGGGTRATGDRSTKAECRRASPGVRRNGSAAGKQNSLPYGPIKHI